MFEGRIAELPMPLDPERVDGHSFRQKLPDMGQNTGALGRVYPTVVIVNQYNGRVHFAGGPECDLNEIGSDDS